LLTYNEVMKRPLIVILPILLVLGYLSGRFMARLPQGTPEKVEVKQQLPPIVVAPIIPETNAEGVLLEEEDKLKMMEAAKSLFKKAGLSEEKIGALFNLDAFHQSMPIFNDENIRMRESYLEVLNQNPGETLNSFSQIISLTTPDDDDLRTFIMNMTSSIEASDEERANVFVTRINQGAVYRDDGAVEDNELSMVIALSQLSRLEDEKAKLSAIEEIKQNNPIDKNPKLHSLLKDYFPELQTNN
jgi:hypothetical protein